MITIFNRKEVLCTYSMEAQSKARDTLTRYGIDYVVNTNGTAVRNYGSGPIGIDRFGSDPALSCEYRIYVNKTDYDMAQAALSGRLEA